MRRLKEVLTPSDGVFKYLALRGNVPWEMESSLLDLRYLSKSGEKFVAPLIDLVVTTPQPSTDNLNTIADTILGLYLNKWNKLYETLSLEYNPIENYRMVETETGSGTTTSNGTTTNTENTTMSGTTSNTTHSETSNSRDTTTDNMIFGFNSSSAKNSDQVVTSETGSSDSDGTSSTTDSNEGSSTNNGTVSNEGTTNTNRELTRSGNIGVTTSQQMIESERYLWEWNFFEIVFRDVDYLLTLQVYGGV